MTTTPPFAEPAAELPGGVRMPLIGFGTWQITGHEARDSVAAALRAGYRHIDTATGYGNQSEVGAALRDSGLSRDEVFVTTKMPPDHAGRELQTLRESLDELGLDHLDLWLVHWPPGKSAAPETWREFVRAREQGLTRAIGVSNYSLDQVDEITKATDVAPAVNQIPWSPSRFDAGLVEGHRQRGVVIEGYSPFRKERFDDPTLARIAERHGKNAAQVIVRWHLQHGIVVIPKSVHEERIASNADVLDFELSGPEMAEVNGLAGSS